MIPRGGGYRRITAEDANRDEVTNPIASAETACSSSTSSSGLKTLRVLYKEQSHEVTDLSGDLPVSVLKERIASLTEVPVERQRLIFSGKPLRPNEARLSQFKLEDGAKVHLFPLPAAQTVPVAAAVAQSSPSLNASPTIINATALPGSVQTQQYQGQLQYEGITLTPAHMDPYVMQTGREIKMWCVVLIFLSTISLFNNLSYFSATGNFGNGGLDSFVFILDTICSAAGMAVGSLGLKSIRTLDIEDLRKYLRHLMMLAAACIVLRICWVFDVSEAVHKAYRKAKHDQEENSEQPPDDTQLDHNAVAAFTIEATLIALICIGAWLSCVTRAVRLHNAVLAYQQAPTTLNPAAVPTTEPAVV